MVTMVSFSWWEEDPSPASLETGGKGSLHTGSVRLPSGGGQLSRASWTQQVPHGDTRFRAVTVFLPHKETLGGTPPRCEPLTVVGLLGPSSSQALVAYVHFLL